MRTYQVGRGETLHGIAKRLSGAADSGEIAEWLAMLQKANGGMRNGVVPESTILNVPEAFPAAPRVQSSNPAVLHFAQREEAANDLEKMWDENLALQRVNADLRAELRRASLAICFLCGALFVISLWLALR